MELVEVHVVGAEPPERALDRIEDVLARVAAVPGPGAHRAEALGGDDETVPSPLEPPAEDLLGASHGVEAAPQRVDVRGVEEGDPVGAGAIENGDGGRLVALEAEGHRAEAEAGDGEAGTAEMDVAHGFES